jgi:hypothetical protein
VPDLPTTTIICYFQDAWKYKDEANLKILWFEDMKKDLVIFKLSLAHVVNKL